MAEGRDVTPADMAGEGDATCVPWVSPPEGMGVSRENSEAGVKLSGVLPCFRDAEEEDRAAASLALETVNGVESGARGGVGGARKAKNGGNAMLALGFSRPPPSPLSLFQLVWS